MSVSWPSLWVIDPSVSRAEDEGVRRIVGDWAGSVRVFQPVLRPGDGPGPDTGHAADGFVLMGSGASVHDSLDWMRELGQWLQPILDGQVARPLLGICFGHQLMAHCAGGVVEFLPEKQGKLLGVETSRLDGSRLLPEAQELRVVVSHREQVRVAPAGYRVVARRDRVAVDGMEHERRPLFSYQFHPEAGQEFAGHAGIEASSLDARQQADSQALLSAFRRQLLVPGRRA